MTDRAKLKKVLPELALGVFLFVCLPLVVLIHHSPGLARYVYAPYSFYILQPDEIRVESVYSGLWLCAQCNSPGAPPARKGGGAAKRADHQPDAADPPAFHL